MTVSRPRPRQGPGAAALLAPIAALGIGALATGRMLSLAERLGGDAPEIAQAAPIAMTLRDGVTARPVLAATLAAEAPVSRPPPVADERPADARLLAEVRRRQTQLDAREQALQTRASQIAAAEELAKRELAELARLRTGLEAMVAHETSAADADIDLLVGLYQNMRPPQAAAVLGKLAPAKAALILEKIETRSAGPILAAMDPAAALAVTEEIEQRRGGFRPGARE
jgi:flagellar motility protein MotE (MotC chaperone)